MMPYFEVFFLGAIGLVEVLLGLFFFYKYQRSPATLTFGLFSISVGFWVIINGPVLLFGTSSIYFDLFTRAAWIFALIALQLLYLFIHLFPVPSGKLVLSNRFLYIFFLPTIIVLLLLYFSNSIVSGFESDALGYPIYGQDYWIVFWLILFYFLIVLYDGFRRLFKLDGVHRSLAKLLMLGVLFSGGIGVINHLILPYIFDIKQIGWLGPGASIIWLLATAYTMNRR